MNKRKIIVLSLAFCLLGLSQYTFAQRKGKKADPPTVAKEKPTKKEKSYEDLIKDLKKDEGIFTVYQDDDKVMYQIPKSDLNKDMLWVTRVVSVPDNFSGFTGSGYKIIEQVV